MHITEGIITGRQALIYTGLGAALVGLGTARLRKMMRQAPENKPFMGMGAALIFFISLIPIPAFSGTCSHPCGAPLIAILLGPAAGMALTGVSLLLQAAFFAHGGFGTWGANVVALGFFGCFIGWGAFRLARRMGLPLWAAGFAGGLMGDLAVYASSGLILSHTLSVAPAPQYSLTGYLTVIYLAYLPTQLPIAVGEMIVTGLALQHAWKQRPDVLEALGVIKKKTFTSRTVKMVVTSAILLHVLLPANPGIAADQEKPLRTSVDSGSVSPPPVDKRYAGLDESVNERLAAAAGRPARDPLFNTERMGDLWNLLLLSAGGICGFIVGRRWHLLWGRPERNGERPCAFREP